MSSLFTMIGTLITNLTGSTGWIYQFCNCIVSNDLLLFFCGLSLVGMAVGFITRLIHARG